MQETVRCATIDDYWSKFVGEENTLFGDCHVVPHKRICNDKIILDVLIYSWFNCCCCFSQKIVLFEKSMHFQRFKTRAFVVKIFADDE